jgi:putative oxidoreductase
MATDLALLVLRVAVGLVFAAHGAQKAFGWWSGPGFAGWRSAMERMNLRPAGLWATLSMGVELVGGLLFAAGLFTPFAAAALIAQSIVIIGQVHWQNGFFNTKGGYEFPLTLGVAAAAILLAGAGAYALDATFGLDYPIEVRIGLAIVAVIGAAIALATPRVSSPGASASG